LRYFFTNDIDEDRKIKNATRMTAVLLGGIAGGLCHNIRQFKLGYLPLKFF